MSSSKVAKSKEIEIERGVPTSDLTAVLEPNFASVVSGEIIQVTSGGEISVDFPRNMLGPLRARTIIQELHPGAKVLLAFDNGDPTRPIVLGVVHDGAQAKGRTIHLKASRIVIEAQDELLLHCGETALEARCNGRVDLKGRDIVTRATRTNKVRGATVLIN